MSDETPDADGSTGTSDADDTVAELETQRRLWVRALTPLLALRTHESDPSPRVQLAYDLLHIAACERLGRILGSDVS